MTDLKPSFERVKTNYRRPPVKGPREMKEGTALINLLDCEVSINPEFAEELAAVKGMDIETILEGLNEHEFGHYMEFPRNLSMNIFLSYKAQKKYGENAEDVHGLFIDVIDNCLVYDSGISQNDGLKKLMEASFKKLQENQLSSTAAAMALVYKDKLCIDIDIDLSQFDNKEDIEKAVERINGMTIRPVEDYGLQSSQLIRFGDAIEPLLKHDGKNKQKRNGSNGSPDEGMYIDKEDMEKMSSNEKKAIVDAVKKLSKSLPKRIYDEISEEFLDNKKVNPKKGSGIGRGSTDTGFADAKTIEYYRTVAKEFGIFIRPKKKLAEDKTEIPMHMTGYSPSTPINRARFEHSGGMIIPGITKAIEDIEIPCVAKKDFVPRLLIYKDVSGSMADPRETKDYATIAAAIFALSYRRSGAEVGVSLFDDGSDELVFSRKEDELLSVLCGYKGGGTEIDMERLKKDLELSEKRSYINSMSEEEIKRNPMMRAYLKKNARLSTPPSTESSTDFVIITDGGIGNLSEVLNFLRENPQYRPTIIHTGDFGLDIPGYNGETGVYEGVQVLKANNRKDIVDIAKGSVKRNLLSKYYVGRD
ncbi:MAG: hypothetical protein PHC66_04095 [Candidatus Nanoarchaeia archaeon]|nr:hypothetical protein [Candidatus Nanoarchaeia archaeon]MDD5238893.1 hypothetical protein [Candidatus Nanoarchaeia archaeon]